MVTRDPCGLHQACTSQILESHDVVGGHVQAY